MPERKNEPETREIPLPKYASTILNDWALSLYRSRARKFAESGNLEKVKLYKALSKGIRETLRTGHPNPHSLKAIAHMMRQKSTESPIALTPADVQAWMESSRRFKRLQRKP